MDFKVFIDRDLTKEIKGPIDLGKLKAGQVKKYEFYVFNDSIHPYEEMDFLVDDPEVQVISHPEELSEKASSLFTLEWKPSVDIKKGLKTQLEIQGYKVIS